MLISQSGITTINFLMNLFLVGIYVLYCLFILMMIVYLLLYNLLYFSKNVTWAFYADKAHKKFNTSGISFEKK